MIIKIKAERNFFSQFPLRTLSILLISIFLIPSFVVQAKDKCELYIEKDNLKITKYNHPKLGCALIIQHSFQFYQNNETRTRTATFFKNGLVHFFVGTSDHERLSKATGAKSVHIIPFNETAININDSETDGIQFTTSSGHIGKALYETGLISEISDYEIAFDPLTHIDILAKNNGGININPKPGNILIDYGFRLGEQPISQLNRDATIKDGYGNSCPIKVKDVFKKDPSDRDEVVLLYSSTESMLKFINKKCPKIKL